MLYDFDGDNTRRRIELTKKYVGRKGFCCKFVLDSIAGFNDQYKITYGLG